MRLEDGYQLDGYNTIDTISKAVDILLATVPTQEINE
jgi:hypothetical protein